MNPITWIKLKAFESAMNSLSVKEIADVIVEFGKKEFDNDYDKYVRGLRDKLALLNIELGKRI